MSLNHLKSIQALQSDTGSRISKRQREAEAHYERGMGFLMQAQALEFKEPQLLESALVSCIEAIRYNRQDPRPYLSCAYIFMLVNDLKNAQEYLQGAMVLAPENEVILLFQDLMKAYRKELQAVAWEPKPGADKDEDPLQRYTRVETTIHKLVQTAMATPSLDPSPQEAVFLQIKQKSTDFYNQLESLRQDLKILDEDMDISKLQMLLKPVEILSKRLEKAYKAAQEMRTLEKRIFREQQHCTALLNQAQGAAANPNELDTGLNALLDNCDRIADGLDWIDEQRYSIAELEPGYQRLIASIEQLQDQLDF